MDTPGTGLRIAVRVRPGASRTRVGGRYGADALVVAVGARPVEGRANAALVEAVAEAFAVRRSAVTLLSGHTGRDKLVFVAGDPDALRVRLAALRDG